MVKARLFVVISRHANALLVSPTGLRRKG